jgi:hypothetical protein
MEFLMEVYAYFVAHQAVIVGFLFALSEVLALIPGVKSNSVFELFVSLVKKLAPKKEIE